MMETLMGELRNKIDEAISSSEEEYTETDSMMSSPLLSPQMDPKNKFSLSSLMKNIKAGIYPDNPKDFIPEEEEEVKLSEKELEKIK
jgi:hypothetical protein